MQGKGRGERKTPVGGGSRREDTTEKHPIRVSQEATPPGWTGPTR